MMKSNAPYIKQAHTKLPPFPGTPRAKRPGQPHKSHPANRNERLASWHQRMHSLFTRQTY